MLGQNGPEEEGLRCVTRNLDKKDVANGRCASSVLVISPPQTSNNPVVSPISPL